MSGLLSNIFLAIIWQGITADFSPANGIIGFGLGFAILALVKPVQPDTVYFYRVGLTLRFLGYFIKELVVANARVFYDAATPGLFARPAILAIPLEAKSDLEITLLACLITLTPGTLSLDVSDDRKVLYVHDMYAIDDQESIAAIKNGLEKRMLEVLR